MKKYTASDLQDPRTRAEIEKLIGKEDAIRVSGELATLVLVWIYDSSEFASFEVSIKKLKNESLGSIRYADEIEVDEPEKTDLRITHGRFVHSLGERCYFCDRVKESTSKPVEGLSEQKPPTGEPEEKTDYNPSGCYSCAHQGSFCNSTNHASGKTDQPAAEDWEVDFEDLMFKYANQWEPFNNTPFGVSPTTRPLTEFIRNLLATKDAEIERLRNQNEIYEIELMINS